MEEADHQAPPLSLRVACYCGYRGDETPERFYLGARKVEVVDVVDRWLAPDYSYFKVQGDDGGTYILRHDAQSGRWELTMFSAGTRSALPW
jgi:hypothetical protein